MPDGQSKDNFKKLTKSFKTRPNIKFGWFLKKENTLYIW